MLNNTSLIVNEYGGILSRLIEKPMVRIDGHFNETEFEKEVAPLFKQQYLDVVIFDASALKDKVLEALRYLKVNLPSTVRLIVLYPNLEDDETYKQMLVYGIYDVIRPHIDKNTMSDTDIENKIIAEVNWALNEPVPFSKVADNLSISVITHNVAPSVEVKRIKENKLVRPRLLGFYNENDDAFAEIKSSGRYNILGIFKMGDDVIEKLNFEAVDLIVMDEASADFASYMRSLTAINENKATLLVGYKDRHSAEASTIKGVRCFEYDGTPEHFARQVSVVYGKADEKPVDTSHKVYAFYGVKGGVGTTSLASLIAMDYAKKHETSKVAIIDFSAQAGDLGEKFGISKPDPNLFECVATFVKAKKEHMDIDLLKDKIIGYCHYDPKKKVYVLPTAYTDIYRYTNYLYSTEEIAGIYKYILEAFREIFDVTFIDVTCFGGFPYELAIHSSDRIFLVGNAKLSSTGHLLSKIDELKDAELNDKVFILLNGVDTKRSENEYENVKIIKSHFKDSRIIEFPVDKTMKREDEELSLNCSKKYTKTMNDLWDKVNGVPKSKKGFLWKK
ncbi:MAG: AAA family ATPase [Erysipelotrichaceae bacterium]|nr:AAA family ATPase [Erysipelotrichaceae bacterium]